MLELFKRVTKDLFATGSKTSFQSLNSAFSSSGLQRMKGVQVEQFGGPEVLQVKDSLPVPSYTPTQVLVKVASFGINPVETYIRQGQYARLPKLPYTPGGDAAGVVEAVGAEVETFRVGDRVYVCGQNSGSYAEYVASEASMTFSLHPSLSFSQGAALGVPYFTAYRALIFVGKLKEGENLLVHGASGAVGTAAVQIAKAFGAKVFGTAGTEEGLQLVKRCGAHQVFNHTEDAYNVKLMEATNKEGFDVILENLANVNLNVDLQMIKRNARVLVVGCRGSVEINPRLLMVPEASITGVSLFSSTPKEFRNMGGALNDGCEAGWLNPVVGKEYTIDEIQQAHHDIIHAKGATGKLVVKLSES